MHWGKINALAVRRFGSNPLAEEAALAVIEGLAADNWRRVSVFSGQASFYSFIMAISARIMEDFARKRFGRLRPPLWVQTFGGIWQKLFQALCVERLPVLDAVEVVQQRSRMDAEKATIETAAYELLARIPDCGMSRGTEVPFDEVAAMQEGDAGVEPAGTFETRRQKELFLAVFHLILGQEGEVDRELLQKYHSLKITLKPEEKLLLKLCYQDGLGVTEAGAMLDMNRFQAHGRMRRLLQRLEEEFQRCGLTKTLRSMLGA